MLICKECGRSHKEYYYLAGGPFGVGEILCKGCWEKYLKVEGDREYRVRMLWAEKQQFQKQWEREHNQDIYCCRDPKWEQLQITLGSFMRGKKYDYTRLRNARLITESQSHYFETVTLPAEQEAVRKAKEERLRAEQEAEKKRIAEEKERKKKEEDERKREEEERQRKKEEKFRRKEEQERIDREYAKYLKLIQRAILADDAQDIEQYEKQSKKQIRFLIVLAIIAAILFYLRFSLL